MSCKLGEHQEPTVTGTKRTKGKQDGRGRTALRKARSHACRPGLTPWQPDWLSLLREQPEYLHLSRAVLAAWNAQTGLCSSGSSPGWPSLAILSRIARFFVLVGHCFVCFFFPSVTCKASGAVLPNRTMCDDKNALCCLIWQHHIKYLSVASTTKVLNF